MMARAPARMSMNGRRRRKRDLDPGAARSAAGIWSLVVRSTTGCEGEKKAAGKGVVEWDVRG